LIHSWTRFLSLFHYNASYLSHLLRVPTSVLFTLKSWLSGALVLVVIHYGPLIVDNAYHRASHSNKMCDLIRLGSQKIPSWLVVWSQWFRARKLQLFFYMVLTGAQNMQIYLCSLCWSYPWNSCCIVIQLLFRMEICITIAWGIWYWDLDHWHSWLGFLWFRFGFYYFDYCMLLLTLFVHQIFKMLSPLLFFFSVHQKNFLPVMWYPSVITSTRY